MTELRSSSPDPVDGLRLALLQRRTEQLRKRLQFRALGMMEGLLLLMLACGITLLVMARPGRSHIQYLVMGWALIVQALGLGWSARQSAAKELQRIGKRIAAMTQASDGEVVAAAATAARELLLRNS